MQIKTRKIVPKSDLFAQNQEKVSWAKPPHLVQPDKTERVRDSDAACPTGIPPKPNKLPLAPCSKKKERFACLSKLRQTNRPFSLRRVRDSNPRYDVMRTPHFECGSFDHSDNSPRRFRRAMKIKIFGSPTHSIFENWVQKYCFFLKCANKFAKKLILL